MLPTLGITSDLHPSPQRYEYFIMFRALRKPVSGGHPSYRRSSLYMYTMHEPVLILDHTYSRAIGYLVRYSAASVDSEQTVVIFLFCFSEYKLAAGTFCTGYCMAGDWNRTYEVRALRTYQGMRFYSGFAWHITPHHSMTRRGIMMLALIH